MTQERDFSDYYQSLSFQQRQHWDTQERFLHAYKQLGKLNRSAEAAQISIHTVEGWQRLDTHGFNKRLEAAHSVYVESWEQEMDNRLANPSGNRGSDVLLMFKLKAERPEKYREEVKVIGVEASKQMMDKLRDLAAKDLAAREQESPAVEGVYQEVPPLPPPVNPPRGTVASPDRPHQKERRIAQQRGRKGRVHRR
jgi:hypothetical protein